MAAPYVVPDPVLSRQLYFLGLISLLLFISSMPERQRGPQRGSKKEEIQKGKKISARHGEHKQNVNL